MKKMLVALFTLVALSIGAQSFAACPCGCSSSYCYSGSYGNNNLSGYNNMVSPCGCPIAQPCCPAAPCCPVAKPCCTPACPCPAAPCCDPCVKPCPCPAAPCCNDCCD